jgi:hypothetical protein
MMSEKYCVEQSINRYVNLWFITDVNNNSAVNMQFTTQESALDFCAAMNWGAHLRSLPPFVPPMPRPDENFVVTK